MTSTDRDDAQPGVLEQAAAVKESAGHLERTAGAVRQSTHALVDSADRRTELAADRTVLAAERTYAAWVRTGLAALASGVGARALLAHVAPGWLGGLTGSVLIGFSAFCFIAAVWRELRPRVLSPEHETHRLPAPLLLGMNGFLVLVALAALVGVWIGASPGP